MALTITPLTEAAHRWGRRAAACLLARPLLWSAVLAAALTVLSAGPLSPSLYMNDDVGMAEVVDGSQTDRPAPHMVYTNVVVGLVLRALYNSAGSVPWYGVYLFAAHFVALTAVLYVVLADCRPDRGWRLLAATAWLAVFGLWMGTQITFTQVALLLGAAGFLLYLARASLVGAHWRAVAAAGALVGASSLIRVESFWAVMVLSLPLVLLAVRRITWRRQVLFATVAATVVLFGWSFRTVYYADRPDWQQFFALNDARNDLDFPTAVTAVDEQILSAVGWSTNDLAMFRFYFYTDPDVYSTENFLQVAGATGNPLLSPAQAADQLRQEIDVSVAVPGLALTGALLVAGWAHGGRLTRLFLVLNAGWFLATLGALLFQYKLPGRVALPVLSFLALLLLTVPEAVAPDAGARPGGPGSTVGLAWRAFRSERWTHREYGSAPVMTRLVAVVSAAVLVLGVVDAVAGAGRRQANDRSLDQDLARLEELDPEGTFVFLGDTLGTGRRSPWHAPILASPRLINLGWQQRTPLFYRRLAEADIDDLYLAVGSREDVYLPLQTGHSTAVAQHYLTYLEEHYGFLGLLRPKAELGDYLVFDLAVAYQVDDSVRVVIERRPDGTEVRYPFIEDMIVGVARPHVVQDGLRIVGWAVDLEAGGPVDHIVTFNGTRGVAVTISTTEPPTPAAIRHLEKLGFTDHDSLGFDLTAAGLSDTGVRFFAISNGRAAEITG